jgi:hypothetical protein
MNCSHPTKLPILLRLRRSIEDVLCQFNPPETVGDSAEFATMLSEALKHWHAPLEDRETLVECARSLPPEGFISLVTISKLLIPGADIGPQTWPALNEDSITPLLENPYCSIWTEKGYSYGTELEYREKYAIGPSGPKPLVWVNRISEEYYVFAQGRRRKTHLNGQKLELLCIFFREFNKAVTIEQLQSITVNHPQVLNQLHIATFNVLRPFIDKEPGEFRIIRAYSTHNRKRRFTFCLIEESQISDRDEQNSKGK